MANAAVRLRSRAWTPIRAPALSADVAHDLGRPYAHGTDRRRLIAARMRPVDLGWSKRARAPCTTDHGVSRCARERIRVADPSKAIAADLDHRAAEVG
jgi:hypothetical protein